MQHRGKWVIAAVVALGVTVSLLAIWYLNRQSRQALEFWGSQTARLIVQAPQAELLRLSPAPETAEANAANSASDTVDIGGRPYSIVERRDAIATRGFIHIRRGLMADATFEWPAEASDDRAQWEFAVRFVDGQEQATVAVAFDPPRVTHSGGQRSVSIAPVATGVETFFREAFHSDPP